MNRLMLFLSLLVFAFAGCKEKKKILLTGEEPVEVTEFIDFFPEVKLPFTVYDTSLVKKQSDSSLIAYQVFTKFISDSVIKKDFGKTKPKLYAIARAKENNKETYLFVKAVHGNRRIAYLICFDKKNKYLNAIPIIKTGGDDFTSSYGSLDKKFQINTYKEKKSKSGELYFKRNVFFYNNASNDFTLILTEPNEETMEDILNPIDTLSQKNKYTGDYVSNKKNFISFRDGKSSSEIIFFTHFEKNKGECIGELKGIANFVSPKVVRYNKSGNPCTIEFTFTPTAVVMKEVEGCGSFRDIKCFFDATFPKKKKKTNKK